VRIRPVFMWSGNPSLSSGVFSGNHFPLYSHPRLWTGSTLRRRTDTLRHVEQELPDQAAIAHGCGNSDINPHTQSWTAGMIPAHILQRSDGRKGEHLWADGHTIGDIWEVVPSSIQSLSILPRRDGVTTRRVPYQLSHLWAQGGLCASLPTVILPVEPRASSSPPRTPARLHPDQWWDGGCTRGGIVGYTGWYGRVVHTPA